MIGRNRAADAVGGLVARDHQLGALDRAERAGERPRGLDQVRAMHAVVEQVYGLVGTHGQGLADGLGRAFGAPL